MDIGRINFNSLNNRTSIEIRKALLSDAKILSEVAVPSFLIAHELSAPKTEIDYFITQNYQVQHFEKELQNEANHYFLIFWEENIAGYSKIIFNNQTGIAKLDRFYFLKDFHGKGLAKNLLSHNIELSKKMQQSSLQLYTWVGNERAIAFYTKNGFQIIGAYDFPISPNRKNPNHLMELKL